MLRYKRNSIFLIAFLAASLVLLIVSISRIFSIEASLRRYSSDLATLKTFDPPELERLQTQLQLLESRASTNDNGVSLPNKGEVSDIGNWAHSLFKTSGLVVESYRTSKSENAAVFEFVISGRIDWFVQVLQKAAEYEYSPKVLSFRLNVASNGNITSTIRIGYE